VTGHGTDEQREQGRASTAVPGDEHDDGEQGDEGETVAEQRVEEPAQHDRQGRKDQRTAVGPQDRSSRAAHRQPPQPVPPPPRGRQFGPPANPTASRQRSSVIVAQGGLVSDDEAAGSRKGARSWAPATGRATWGTLLPARCRIVLFVLV